MSTRRFLPAALLAALLIYSFSALASDPIQFSPADSYALSTTQFRMTSGDFNQDGWPDLVVVQDNTKYSILMNNGAGGFTTATYTVTGSRLKDVAVVNLAGDTIPDLMMSDYLGFVRVFTGAGDGTFTLSASAPITVNRAQGIAGGDFNGDGYPDAAVCMFNLNQVGVLLGTAGGSLGTPTYYTTGSCDDLDVGLVNADGYQDIVTANWTSDNITVLLGNGDGTFATPANIPCGNDNTDVALADIDHDGKLDAVVGSYADKKVYIMLGDGLGGFSLSQALSVITGPQQVRVADFNADGFLDIATANASAAPGMALLQATGYNIFMAAATFHSDQAANGLAIADFNRDTGPDVATSHFGNSSVRVMKVVLPADTDGDGMPDWWENQYPCLNPLVGDSTLDADSDGLRNIEEFTHSTDPCLADSDGDGLSDGAEVNTYLTNPTKPDTDNDWMPDNYEVLQACLNPVLADGALDPDGDFGTNLFEYQRGTDPCVFTDTDGDGMPDGWEIQYYSCALDPNVNDAGLDPDADTLTNLQEYLAHTNPCVANDTDGDGMPDIYEVLHACLNPAVNDASADPDGDLWTNLYEYQHATDPCVFNDADSDGMPDAWEIQYASCGLDPNVNDAGLDPDNDLLPNLAEYQAGTNPCIWDTDGDGMPDGWEAAYACMKPAVADPALDYDTDQLTNLQEYQLGTDPCVFTDSDGDGMPDGWEIKYFCVDRLVNDAGLDPNFNGVTNLAEYQAGTNPCQTVFFGPAASYPISPAPFRMATGDFNKDGYPDLVVTDNGYYYTILMNNRAGGFTVADYSISGAGLRDVAVVNLAGDTIPDLVLSDSSASKIRVLTGSGTGTFTLTASISLTSAADGIAAGDFNGDGYPDVAVCQRTTSKVSVLLGTSGGSFGAATPYSIGACTDLAVGLLNADGFQDLITANGTSDNISVLLGNGNGTFGTATNIAAGDNNNDVALADLNHDGVLDAVLAANASTAAVVLLGDGAGGFTYSQSLPLNGKPNQVRIADFNQDGFLDIATANSSAGPGLSIVEATGYNTFMPAIPFHADQPASGLAIADFNRDMFLDVATSHPNNNTVRVMMGTLTADTDGDLMPDGWEVQYPCLNPLVGDSALDADGDGLRNLQEYAHHSNPCLADTDGDGLNDAAEVNTYLTDPTRADTDVDGMPDGWEVVYACVNPLVADAGLDPDTDQLTNLQEYQLGADPCVWTDTDGDAMPDGWELKYACVNRFVNDANLDPDNDGLTNLQEYQAGTNPCVQNDTDGDLMPDWWEQEHPCMDPNLNDASLDADGDLLTNYDEFIFNTDPCAYTDSDGDGMPDGWEVRYPCLQRLVNDANLDPDSDGLNNFAEYQLGSNPCVSDTDGDAMPDGWEVAHPCMNPIVADGSLDYDSDQLTNLQEYQLGTDPCTQNDTDGDGIPDFYESMRSCLLPTVNDAAADPDGDGMSNLYEYQHGTEPCSPPMPLLGALQGPTTIQCGYKIYQPPDFKQAPSLDAVMDSNGVIHLAWIQEGNNLYYAKRVAGVWSAPEFLSSSCANLRMHLDGADQVHLMWSGISSTNFLTLTSSGWVQEESPMASFCCDMDVTPAGQTYALCHSGVNSWNGAAWELMPGSYTGCTDHDNDYPEGFWVLPGLALGPNGRIHVAYNTPGGIGGCNLYHQEYSPGSGWTTQTVYTYNCHDLWTNVLNQARVRVDTNGQPVIFRDQAKTDSGHSFDESSDFFRRALDNTWTHLRTRSDFYPLWPYGDSFLNDFSTGAFGWVALSRINTSGSGRTDLFFPDGTVTLSAAPWNAPYGLNKLILTADGLHRIVVSEDLLCISEYFLPLLRDDDQDQMPDNWESGFGCLNPHADDAGLDPDGDGLTNLQEYTAGTDPCSWDSDGDNLPDGYEVAHCLNPLVASDGAADTDGDGNSNANEYWNGSDPWSVDPTPGVYENPGCYYWGDGDGDGTPAPSDIIMLKLEIAGAAQNYSFILPHGIDTLDLDRDGYAAPADLILLKLMIAGSERPGGYDSQANALEVVSAPTGSVAAGATTHVTVSVHSVGGSVAYAAGFGVVFAVVSGNAVLLGGDGTADGEAAGNRYDFSMEAAAGARANVVVLVTGPGEITIGAKVPACGTYPNGRWNDEVVLSPGVVINGN